MPVSPTAACCLSAGTWCLPSAVAYLGLYTRSGDDLLSVQILCGFRCLRWCTTQAPPSALEAAAQDWASLGALLAQMLAAHTPSLPDEAGRAALAEAVGALLSSTGVHDTHRSGAECATSAPAFMTSHA